MVWIPFWSSRQKPDAAAGPLAPTDAAAKCPVDHTKLMQHPPAAAAAGAAMCPVDHTKFDPTTNMPANLSATQRVPGQKLALPTERTMSSIPRGDDPDEGVWEYPSPQQMLNAMVRKGHTDTPEADVPAMVDVHNYLNEGAWAEILQWEKKYEDVSGKEPRLLRFTGRPNDLSPRARLMQALGTVYPSKFGGPPPFDRHDWTVLRFASDGSKREVRYVIDYYSGPLEDGYPSFYLDVRPAFDSFASVYDRAEVWTSAVLEKALGRGGRVE
ncbi:cytochrome c/c1 heme-lyase [Limtongia smithiae]|uniref:cytochrome c/c1 heme-lyase n=1 Tax=Limtongia smithiae TaxID=1125753 RepID=UPI0034CFD9AC